MKIKITKKTGILVTLLILTVLIEWLILNKTSFLAQNKHYTVVLNQDGFSPKSLQINQGDSVTFTTSLNQSFWPASDLHPTHTIYPEFDPKKPVESGESWSFTFQHAGEWGFHDHLASLHRGQIIVAGDGDRWFTSDQVSCQIVPDDQKAQCWEKELEQTLQTQGLSAGFDLFAKLFKTEPVFAESCHGYTHKLGEVAYLEFSKQQDFPVTQQTAYCSYGFFHGFIEAMVQKTGSLDQAESFCQYIDKKLAGQTDTLGACYHGIGHGITDGTDPSLYGNPLAMIKPGLELCDRVGKTEYDHKICGTGVFNALAIMYSDPKYKFSLDPNDPFWACKQQSKSYYKHACYDDFKVLLMVMTDNNFLKSARFIEEVPEDSYATGAIDNLASFYVYYLLKNSDYTDPISECHSLQKRLHTACIQGLGAGFMSLGIPDQEYIRALEVCQSPLITEGERDNCHERVMRLIQLRYTREKFQNICQTIDEKYRKQYCV